MKKRELIKKLSEDILYFGDFRLEGSITEYLVDKLEKYQKEEEKLGKKLIDETREQDVQIN